MHVDGFRFDLASILGRDCKATCWPTRRWSRRSPRTRSCADTKLIAEAWDAAGLYQVGSFPPTTAGRSGTAASATTSAASGAATRHGRRAGHPHCRQLRPLRAHGRRPCNSINFITCHDGFTLDDLVSYNEKHNQANGEDNRDGDNNNLSWNCGVEGPTDDPGDPGACAPAACEPWR